MHDGLGAAGDKRGSSGDSQGQEFQDIEGSGREIHSPEVRREAMAALAESRVDCIETIAVRWIPREYSNDSLELATQYLDECFASQTSPDAAELARILGGGVQDASVVTLENGVRFLETDLGDEKSLFDDVHYSALLAGLRAEAALAHRDLIPELQTAFYLRGTDLGDGLIGHEYSTKSGGVESTRVRKEYLVEDSRISVGYGWSSPKDGVPQEFSFKYTQTDPSETVEPDLDQEASCSHKITEIRFFREHGERVRLHVNVKVNVDSKPDNRSDLEWDQIGFQFSFSSDGEPGVVALRKEAGYGARYDCSPRHSPERFTLLSEAIFGVDVTDRVLSLPDTLEAMHEASSQGRALDVAEVIKFR